MLRGVEASRGFVMRIRRLAVVLAAGLTALALEPTRADILIQVDKAAQRMTVTVDGQQRYVWKVSTGMANYDTPDGKFQAFRMERDHFSREWDDAPMPYSIFFTMEGHAIHGSYDVKHLGRPASHGCVRLSTENAAVLFDLVTKQGLKATQVVLTGEIPSGATRAVARRERPAPDDESAAPRQRVYNNARVQSEYPERARYYYYRGRTYVYDPDRGYVDEPDPRYIPPRRYYRPPFPFGW
jgi:hypothetical protein